eukprot:1231028-Amphidinium_carterae.3
MSRISIGAIEHPAKLVVQVHIEALKVGTQDWEFLDMHEHTWPLVMREDQVKLIRGLAADQPWSEVKTALTEVCATSELGRRMFGDKLGELVKDDLKGVVDRAVMKIFALDLCDETNLAQITKKAEEEILSLLDSDLLPPTMEVTVHYRTRPVKLTCRSVSEFVDLACQAAVKTAAVQTGCLQSLPGESAASASVALGPGFKVAPHVVSLLSKTRDWAIKTMKLAAGSTTKNALD